MTIMRGHDIFLDAPRPTETLWGKRKNDVEDLLREAKIQNAERWKWMSQAPNGKPWASLLDK